MAWLNPQFSIADAISREQDTWDLLITNWGDSLNADPTCTSFPATGVPGLPTPAAMAIGPRSDIDRCAVVWDIGKIIPDIGIWDYPRRLSVGAPLLYAQLANQARASGYSGTSAGSVVILSSIFPTATRPGVRDGVIYSATYNKLNGVNATFGPTAVVVRAADSVPAFWLPPLLHVVFYLRPPQVGTPPTKRFPLSMNEVMFGGSVAAGEQLVGQIPIMGRKTVNLLLSSDQICNFRASVLRGINEQYPSQESTVFTAAAVPLGTQVGVTLTDLNADFLFINAAPTAVNNPKVNIALTATDG